MKLYPIIGHTKWTNWTNTYLKEMNSKIRSLFDYIFYFNPDFYQYDLPQTPQLGGNPKVQLAQLPFHGYYRVTNKVLDTTTGKTLEPGTLIVSYARGEGDADNRNAENRNQEKNYTIQPFGWASYYLIQFATKQLNCTYDKRAQETYGLNYVFVFDTMSKRYYIKQYQTARVLDDVKTQQHKSISFLAHNGDIRDTSEWFIVNQNQNGPISSIWTNITTNPLMHEFYYIQHNQDEEKEDVLYQYEELALDHTWETSSKVASTNIAVYTINRKDSSLWPSLDFLWFEAW